MKQTTADLSVGLKQAVLGKVGHIKMDGLSNIIQASHPLVALLWTMMLIANACVCTYLVICTVMQYNSHQVSTTIRWVSEQSAVFPTLTFCSANSLASESALSMVERLGLNANLSGSPYQTYNVYLELEKWMKRTRGSYLNDSERADLFDLDLMLVGCMYEGSACNASYFEFFFNPYFLNCYRFNSRGQQVVSVPGQMSGLFLDLYANAPPGSSNAIRGVNIIIQNATTYPFDVNASPYPLSVGLGTYYIINRVFTKQYEKPYSDCVVLEENQ